MNLRAESKRECLLAALSQAEGRFVGERSQSARSLLAWFNKHTEPWWPAVDPRRAIAKMPDKRGLDDDARILLHQAFRHVYPVSDESLRASADGTKSERVRARLDEIADSKARKDLRDRLVDRLRTEVAGDTAAMLSANEAFLTRFADDADRSESIRSTARDAAASVLAEAVRGVLQAEETQTAISAFLGGSDSIVRQCYSDARRQAGMPPRDLTLSDLERIRETLKQLTSRRYGDPLDSFPPGGPEAEAVRTRAFDLIALGDSFWWGLPTDAAAAEEQCLLDYQSIIEKSVTSKARGCSDSEKQGLVADVWRELWERLRRHIARTIVISGHAPDHDSLHAWAFRAQENIVLGALQELRERQRLFVVKEDVDPKSGLGEVAYAAPGILARCRSIAAARPSLYREDDIDLVAQALADGPKSTGELLGKADAKKATAAQRRAACLLLEAAGSALSGGGDTDG